MLNNGLQALEAWCMTRQLDAWHSFLCAWLQRSVLCLVKTRRSKSFLSAKLWQPLWPCYCGWRTWDTSFPFASLTMKAQSLPSFVVARITQQLMQLLTSFVTKKQLFKCSIGLLELHRIAMLQTLHLVVIANICLTTILMMILGWLPSFWRRWWQAWIEDGGCAEACVCPPGKVCNGSVVGNKQQSIWLSFIYMKFWRDLATVILCFLQFWLSGGLGGPCLDLVFPKTHHRPLLPPQALHAVTHSQCAEACICPPGKSLQWERRWK